MAEAHGSGAATMTRPGLSPVTFPQLGESVVEGTVLQWLVKIGDTVGEDQLLTEIETEKVVAEIPSPFIGVVKEFAVEIGQTVPVGTTLLWIETDAAAATEAASAPAPTTEATAPAPIRAATEAEPKKAEMEMDNATAQMESASTPPPARASASTATNGAKAYTESADASKMYSPAVRKLAMEFGIDPATVSGTGAGGRVTREDMMKAHSAQQATPQQAAAPATSTTESAAPATPAQSPPPAAQPAAQPVAAAASQPALSPHPAQRAPGVLSPSQGDLIPMTAIRRRTAEALTKATQTIPQAASWVEADVTDLVARRTAEKNGFLQREGVPLTYLPFFVMAGLAAIRQYPIISSRWTDEGIRLMRQVGFGIAVSTDDGLQVPVIHNAMDYSITGVAKRLHDIIGRARDGKLKIDDIQGGTITLTNPGSFGSHVTMAMVRPNEACIYSVDAILEKPVVRNGGIAIRSMVTLGITFDHRIFDGREAVLFLNAAKKWLEEEAATAAL
ncbi:MAG: 2-oxo acid dehydrogenase subunit E2 [Chloroflexota bacterium]|nr:2-oxo acid dehydrogenase subunit E2 [Chloroflexota bacterium]